MRSPARFTRHVSRFTQLLLGAALLFLTSGRFPIAAQAPGHAALILDFGDGRVVVRVVSFTGETLSGAELLRQSGLDVAVMVNPGGGAALCAVEGIGCAPTPQECFCQCRGTPCRYWSYFHLQDGAWAYAGMGAANHTLRDGDVDGWVWGDGRTPPPLLSWDEIWARAGAAPTAAPPPTATPLPPATAAPPAATIPTALPLTRAPAPASAIPATVLTAATVPPASPSAPPAVGATVPAAATPAPSSQEPGLQAPTSPSPPTAAGGGAIPWGSLAAFGGLVLLLAALALWLHRRR